MINATGGLRMKHVGCMLILFAAMFHSTQVFAQWSILKDDPRARNPGHHFQVFTQEDWNKSNFASEKDIQWFRDAKYGMFIHFGLSTYENAELSWGICKTRKAPDVGSGPYPKSVWTKWAEEFELPKFNARKLVSYAKNSGMKYIVVIAKHHDGFHMWDTAFSEFKITNTPFGRDFIKEIADACHEADIKFGIYYSQRDWYHPDYCPVDPKKVAQEGTKWTLKSGEIDPTGASHEKYIEYQYSVCRELCTKYGRVDIFWFDAVYYGGMFTAEMWDSENLSRMIRRLQPGIIINNRASIPGDFDTPEQKIGMFQDQRPWESCMCLCDTWSYSQTPTKSPTEIIGMLVGTLCGDGNLLMSWGPQWSGEFHPNQVKALKNAGVWIKENEKAIYGTRGGPWKPGKWGGSVYRGNTVYLHILAMPGEKLVLPALQQRVLTAQTLGGGKINFERKDREIEFTVPKEKQEKLGTIIKLSLDGHVE
jgi:alpha-L-fucosidase